MNWQQGELAALLPLMEAAAEGTCDEQQLAHLAERLDASEAVRAAYCKFVMLEVQLGLEHAPTLDVVPSRPLDSAETVESARWQQFWEEVRCRTSNFTALSLLVSGLFITTILLSLALWIVPDWRPAGPADDVPSTEFVARISGTREATFDKTSDGNLKNRDLFEDDKIVLNTGLVVIEYGTGARVVLEGPATYHVDGANGGDLRLGKLVARVETPASQGFTIEIPGARIVDLGTEFGVEVDAGGGSEVAVLSGEVELLGEPSGEGTAQMLKLAAGESVSVSAVSGKVIRHDQPNERLLASFESRLGTTRSASQAGTITYVDAQTTGENANTVVTRGGSNTWKFRPNFGTSLGNGGIYESYGASDPELTTSITGLDAGTYNVYLFYLGPPAATENNWNLRGGLSSNPDTNQLYDEYGTLSGAIAGTVATELTFSGGNPVATNQDPTYAHYYALLGQATVGAGGTIRVYVDDLGGNTTSVMRSWYDGVGYELVSSSDPHRR